MRCRGSSYSWHLFLLLHAPNQFKRMHTLETIIEEPNEVNCTGAETHRQHRCELLRVCELNQSLSKSEAKTSNEKQLKSESVVNERQVTEENNCSEQKEKGRKQWETSPDQMKEISRSLSQINLSESKEEEIVRTKRAVNESQVNRSTLPPINNLSDSDSGKELTHSCICEGMHKSTGDLRAMHNTTEQNQWVVSRPIRNRPKDNLCLGNGPMEMETTFKTTYDSTAKQINESLSKNIAVVMPSTKVSADESNSLKQSKSNETYAMNAYKSSKKKSKHRPSTSLKAGGDGYFNTINKESYKNFVIIDDNSRVGKAKSSANGKKSSVCCSTVANIKLPKVNSNNREEKQSTRRLSREERATQMEQINRSMHRLTTDDKYESTNADQKSKTYVNNGKEFGETSVQTINSFTQTNGNQRVKQFETKEQKSDENNSFGAQHRGEGMDLRYERQSDEGVSWTIGTMDEHKRVVTQDIDNIKELGILDKTSKQNVRDGDRDRDRNRSEPKERDSRVTKEHNLDSDKSNGSTRVRIESRNYVQSQRRQKKHKNESSMGLFQGQMDFTTTSHTCFVDKSPNRGEDESKRADRERTAGKRSRKSGRKRNLFRTSTEAEFNVPYGEPTPTATTYQKQFGDRLYCPAIDLGSNKSEFKYKGESSGHKFFLPAVKY